MTISPATNGDAEMASELIAEVAGRWSDSLVSSDEAMAEIVNLLARYGVSEKEAADQASVAGPCNEVLDEIGEALAEGIKPDGDPQAALDKLGDIIGIYEESPLVEKDQHDPTAPLDEREQTLVNKIISEREAAQGLLGAKGDPAEGKSDC